MMQINDGNTPRRGINLLCDEQAPGWALGLRSLYQAVADEPIPANFGNLLARLERGAQRSAH